jgi:anaerobic selenocysteine-containing dehydrogenase
MARPALAAPGEAKSNLEIFRLLAGRMGFDDPCFRETEDDMIRALLASGSPFLAGITLERLEREHFVRLNIGTPFLPFAEGVCDLSPGGLGYLPPVESRLGAGQARSRYPLELVSSKCDAGLNSTFGNRPGVDRETALLWMHESDALPRGIATGDALRVFNGRGSCRMEAAVGDGVRPGVVRAPSVRWNKRSPDGQGINVLISDRLADLGGGPTFYNCLVQVEKCRDSI